MTTRDQPKIGAIIWQDLTVDNADEVRDFYSQVFGWTDPGPGMRGYADYNMNDTESRETVTIICHAKGPNVGLPPQWLLFITVTDVAHRKKKYVELGGQVVDAPHILCCSQACVIQYPAGE